VKTPVWISKEKQDVPSAEEKGNKGVEVFGQRKGEKRGEPPSGEKPVGEERENHQHRLLRENRRERNGDKKDQPPSSPEGSCT